MSSAPYAPQPHAPQPAFPATASFYPPAYPPAHAPYGSAPEAYPLADSNPPFLPQNAPYDSAGEPYEAYKVPDAHGSRFAARTPSPTPSEHLFLSRKGLTGIDFKNFKKYFSRKYITNWIAIVVGIAITVVSIVLHDQIINWLRPFGEKIKDLPAGFLIPIAIMVVLSFPPLFGHELVAIVVGVVWGLGIGFAIVAAGTLLGELVSFIVFRVACRGRQEKLEKDLKYGVLAHVVREGGWRIVLMARLSALPPHFTTVVFALCGTPFLTFLAVAVVTLPRQFATVYLGFIAADEVKKTTKQKIVSAVVVGGTIVVTIIAMRWINRQIDAAKPAFVYARRKARRADVAFPPADDDSDEEESVRLVEGYQSVSAPAHA